MEGSLASYRHNKLCWPSTGTKKTYSLSDLHHALCGHWYIAADWCQKQGTRSCTLAPHCQPTPLMYQRRVASASFQLPIPSRGSAVVLSVMRGTPACWLSRGNPPNLVNQGHVSRLTQNHAERILSLPIMLAEGCAPPHPSRPCRCWQPPQTDLLLSPACAMCYRTECPSCADGDYMYQHLWFMRCTACACPATAEPPHTLAA